MKKYPVPENIRRFASIFRDNGKRLYIVGGAVRDHLLGIPNSDFDFCTDAKPAEVISMFRHVIPTGIKHGTVTVVLREGKVASDVASSALDEQGVRLTDFIKSAYGYRAGRVGEALYKLTEQEDHDV